MTPEPSPPLDQPRNRKVNGAQFVGFPFKMHADQKNILATSTVNVIPFLISSFIHLLMCPWDHLSAVVTTGCTSKSQMDGGWVEVVGWGGLYSKLGGHL